MMNSPFHENPVQRKWSESSLRHPSWWPMHNASLLGGHQIRTSRGHSGAARTNVSPYWLHIGNPPPHSPAMEISSSANGPMPLQVKLMGSYQLPYSSTSLATFSPVIQLNTPRPEEDMTSNRWFCRWEKPISVNPPTAISTLGCHSVGGDGILSNSLI